MALACYLPMLAVAGLTRGDNDFWATRLAGAALMLCSVGNLIYSAQWPPPAAAAVAARLGHVADRPRDGGAVQRRAVAVAMCCGGRYRLGRGRASARQPWLLLLLVHGAAARPDRRHALACPARARGVRRRNAAVGAEPARDSSLPCSLMRCPAPRCCWPIAGRPAGLLPLLAALGSVVGTFAGAAALRAGTGALRGKRLPTPEPCGVHSKFNALPLRYASTFV